MAAGEFQIQLRDPSQAGEGRESLYEAMARAVRPEADAWAEIRSRRLAARREIASGAAPPPDAVPGDVVDVQLGRLRRAIEDSGRRGATSPVFALDVHEGLTVTSAPYDYGYQWQAPGTRPPVESTGDAPGGLMLVAGDSSTGDAPVHAVAGVGFFMRSPVRAIVQIRPRITYVWHYSNLANGLLSYAESQGGVELAVWRQRDGALVSSEGVRRTQLFRNHVSPGEFRDHSEDGVVSVDDIQVEVPVETNEGYWVNFGAWVMCDHGAGATVAPTSTGYGRVSSHLEFVVVQRFT